MRYLCLAAAVCLMIAADARAEFVLKTAQSTRAPDTPMQPVPPAPATAPVAENGPPAQAQPTRPRFKMAYGFGKSVPLAFACRQIVPDAVRITYGPGADQAALVNWKGGDTWNHVLRDAVQPLGLHLVMTTMAVEIRR